MSGSALWQRVVLLLTLTLGVASFVSLGGCSGAMQGATDRGPARARFVVSPESARVYNDGHFVGTGRALAVRPAQFRPGPRRFSVLAEGFFPHDLEVDLAPGGVTTIEIALRPIPQ